MHRAFVDQLALRRPRTEAQGKLGRVVESIILFFLIFSLFSTATAILFWQWMPHLSTALLGPPEDNMQDFWNTWYAASASTSGHFFFTDLIRYPEGTPLYYHSFAYPKIIAIALLLQVIGSTDASSLVLMQNLSVLISFPLAGVGAFYLVRHITSSSVGAFLGGFVFAFNPSHVQHAMHHVGVSSIEFIPFFVILYLLLVERRNPFFLLGAIGFYALSALSCWYYLFYLAYFMVFHVIYLAVRDRAWPTGWQLSTCAATFGGVGVVLAPIMIPMVAIALGGSAVHAAGSDIFVADLIAFFAVPSYHALGTLADGVYARLSGNEWEATVYLGCVNIAVLMWLRLFAPQSSKQLVLYVLWGMAVFCVLAAGDSLHVLGYSTVPMPGAVLSQLPFFSNVRTPSRAIVMVYMFLAIGIGHAIGLMLKHRSGRSACWGAGALAILMVLDFSPVRQLPTTPIVCSPGLAIIRDDAETGFAVLDLPRGGWYEGSFYMMQQAACHKRPILHGTTSRAVVKSLRDRLETSDLREQKRQLVEAKVKYLILRPDGEISGMRLSWLPDDGPRQRYLLTYQVVYNGPDLTILRVY
jgi:hypothetical protein